MVDEVWPHGVDPGSTEPELTQGGTLKDGSDGQRPELALASRSSFAPSVNVNLPAGFHPATRGFQGEDLREPIRLVGCRGRLTGHDNPQGGRVRDNISEASEVYPAPRLWHPPSR